MRLSGSHRPDGRYRLGCRSFGEPIVNRRPTRGTRRDRQSAGACLRAVTLALICVALPLGAGCGSASTPRPLGVQRAARPVTLVLDFTPNAVHAGIYRAL